MPYDEERPRGGVAGNVRVLLMLWLLAAGVAGVGLMMLSEDNRTAGIVMIAFAVVTVPAGILLVRVLSRDRAGREG